MVHHKVSGWCVFRSTVYNEKIVSSWESWSRPSLNQHLSSYRKSKRCHILKGFREQDRLHFTKRPFCMRLTFRAKYTLNYLFNVVTFGAVHRVCKWQQWSVNYYPVDHVGKEFNNISQCKIANNTGISSSTSHNIIKWLTCFTNTNKCKVKVQTRPCRNKAASSGSEPKWKNKNLLWFGTM